MSLVGKRYAEALIDLSIEKDRLEDDRRQLGLLIDFYNNQPDLRELFHNPRISRDKKKDVLRILFEKEFESSILNLAMLLVDNDRIKFLSDIYMEYERLADTRSNVLNMVVVSAMPLEGYQLEKLRDKYKKQYKASAVTIEMKIDKSLIAGIKVIIGDQVIDGTMKNRLENLRDKIAGN